MSEPTTPGDVIRCTAAEFEHYLSLNPPDPPRPDLHQLCQRALKLADAVDKMTGLLRESTDWVPSKLHDRINAVLEEPTT